MRIAKLEKDKKLKRQVINRLAQDGHQWDIARSVGLNQSQISRFAAKYKEQIELKRMDLQFKQSMRIMEMAFKPNTTSLSQAEEAKWQDYIEAIGRPWLCEDQRRRENIGIPASRTPVCAVFPEYQLCSIFTLSLVIIGRKTYTQLFYDA